MIAVSIQIPNNNKEMRLNQNGLSLIEISIAAALTAIVALGGAFVVSRSQQTAVFSTIQNDIDRTHYLNIQVARNVNNVLAAIGIDPTKTTIEQQDPNLLACLQMNPQNTIDCTTYNNHAPYQLLNPNLLATSPDATSTVTFLPHCVTIPGSTKSGCDAIVVKVQTQYKNSNNSSLSLNYATRTSISNMPNYLFIPRNQINYTCPSPDQVLYGIDYYNQDPLCTGITGTSGSTNVNGLPIIVYDSGTIDSWTSPNAISCPNGYVSVGFGGSVCRTSTNLTPPATTTTTTVPGPTTTTLPPTGPTYTAESICFSMMGFGGGANCQPGTTGTWMSGGVEPDPPALTFNVTITYNGSTQAVSFNSMGPGTETVGVGGGSFKVTINGGTTNNCPAANPAFAGSCLVHAMGSVTGP